MEKARAQLKQFQELHASMSQEERDADPGLEEQATCLMSLLSKHG
jgi:hypothetical protein